MLIKLPPQDLIAFYAFSVFMSINNHSDFFNAGVLKQDDRIFVATLSLDEEGTVYENQKSKGCITFTLSFSFKLHRDRMKAKAAAGKKKESHDNELYYSYYEQIPEQIYQQALTLNSKQLSIKDNCLNALFKLYNANANEIEVLNACQQTMLSVTTMGSVTVLH